MTDALSAPVSALNGLAKLFGLRPRHTDPRDFLLAMLPKDSIGAEIGVHKGDFSAQLLRAVTPRTLHLIDPWKFESSETYKDSWYGGKTGGGQGEMDARYEGVRQRFQQELASGRMAIHRDYSGDALGKLPDASLDWAYIDGNHLYEFVKQDLELCFAKVRPGGFITGDDYEEGNWWEGGVKKAVDEFIQQHPVKLLALQNAQFVLQK